MPIRVLSEETINKIAAGEVVERPANAVKELVENSLDAGARRVELELSGAGRKLIRVSDDGGGMSRGEMTLSVTRHATSKISDFTDIARLSTLGFRGEALPSIASVSRLTIKSQPQKGDGWEISLCAGKLQESRAWSGSRGTIVEVSELFFNTPARSKFLKSDATERTRAIRIVEELALARHDIAFHIISEGKTILAAPKAGTRFERIMDVLGGDFAKSLLPIEAVHPQLKITGFVTRTENGQQNKNSQFFFVNGRPVNPGRAITHALYEAYRENLPSGRHPGCVIFLETDPAEVDVNVHPAKREVRFSRESELHHLLYRAVKEPLSSTPFSASVIFQAPGSAPRPSGDPAPGVIEPKTSFTSSFPVLDIFQAPAGAAPQQRDFSGTFDEAPVKPLEQVFGLYLIAESGEELLIVDQHAAAERIRYEKYRAQSEKKKIPLQQLLIPVTLELAPSQAALLRENLSVLREAGWEIEEFGHSAVRVTALPAILGNNLETKNALATVLSALAEESKLPNPEKIEKIIRAACRSSVKAGDFVSTREGKELLAELFRCKSPYTCPHGRPTVFKISRKDLAKYFGRS